MTLTLEISDPVYAFGITAYLFLADPLLVKERVRICMPAA